MGREVFKYTEIDADDFQRVNQTTVTLEFFHTATYTTGSGSPSTSLAVADRGGFNDADKLYIGTTDLDTGIESGGSTIGSGSFTIGSSSWDDNDAVILYKRGVTSQRATWYDDPDFTTVSTAIITLDPNNEAVVFLKPGAYGLVFKSGGTVVRTDYHEVIEELDWVTVTPEHKSSTAGIGEAVRRLNTTSGGKVYIPAGTFNITTAIKLLQLDGTTIADNIHLSGAGPGLTILKVPNGTGDIGNGIFDIGISNNITISDMTLNGNQADATNGANGAEDYEGIYSDGGDDITIRNVVITQTRKGIYSTTGTNNRWLIQDCYINDVGAEGILVEDMNKCQIVDNKIVTCGNDGIAVAGGGNANDDIIITNNYVNKSGTSTRIEDGGNQQGACVKIRNSNNVIVSDNVLIATINVVGLTNGIETDPADVNHCVFSNNIVRDTELAGILVANNCVVSNNYIFNAGEDGIKMLPSAATALETVTITNNTIVDCNETTNADNDIAGIHIDGADTIHDTPGPATFAPTINHLVITGNNVFDSRATARMDYNVIIAAKASTPSITKLVITGNDFSGATQQKSILWTAVDVTSVPEIVWRSNAMSNTTGDEYYGVATLATGAYVIINTNWPAHTGNRFNISRTDLNSSTLSGALEGIGSNVGRTLTITSHGSAINTIQRAEDFVTSADEEDVALFHFAPNTGGGHQSQDNLLAPITGTVSTFVIQTGTLAGGTASDSMDYVLIDEDKVLLSAAQTIRNDSDNTIFSIAGTANATTVGKALQIRTESEVGTTWAASSILKMWIQWGSAAVEVLDVSKVYWEYVGTPPATAGTSD